MADKCLAVAQCRGLAGYWGMSGEAQAAVAPARAEVTWRTGERRLFGIQTEGLVALGALLDDSAVVAFAGP